MADNVESTEPMEEGRASQRTAGVNQTWRLVGLCVVDGEKTAVDSRDKWKDAGRNDLLFVAKMM